MATTRNHLSGIAMIAASTLAWSLTGYFTRLVALDSITLIAWRGLFGAICLFGLAIVLRGRDWKREFQIFGKLELLYILNSTAGTIMLFTAFAYTSVGHVSVIFAMLPFVAAFFGWLFLRETPAATAIFASSVALGGVIYMVALGNDGNLLGDLLAFGMTISTTFIIILNRRHPGMPAVGCSAGAMALSAILLLPFAQYELVSSLQLSQIAIFALINAVFGVALYALGSRWIPAVEVALISALDAPLAILWVWLAFGEAPGWNTIIGGIAVIGAVMFHILVSAGRRKPAIA